MKRDAMRASYRATRRLVRKLQFCVQAKLGFFGVQVKFTGQNHFSTLLQAAATPATKAYPPRERAVAIALERAGIIYLASFDIIIAEI